MTTADLRSLPRSGSWEVDIIEIPDLSVEGADLEGVLLVVDGTSGTVRYAGPVERGEGLSAALLLAAFEPAPPLVPSRPRAIRCRRALMHRLQEAAASLGVRLKRQSRLRALEPAAASLIASTVGGLPRDPQRWAPLVSRLVAGAPWQFVSDSVQVRFPLAAPPLREAVALILGQAGEQRGVVIYPSEDDLESFHAMVDAGIPDRAARFTCWCAHLDPMEEFPPRVRDLLRSGGLVAGGFGLRVWVMEGFDGRPLTIAEEGALATAIEGILGLWDARGPLMEWEPQALQVDTSEGPLDVVALPVGGGEERDPLILDVAHQVALVRGRVQGREQPLLILKMAKKDARRLTREVAGLDGISLHPVEEGRVQVVGWAGPIELGVLTEAGDSRMAWAGWRREGGGSVAISGGGSKRAGFKAKDFVSVHRVELLRLEGEEDDDMFSEWGDDPKAWPKASEVLITFGELAELGRDDPGQLKGAAQFAATIWNAVVIADELGDRSHLDDATAALTTDPFSALMLESMVARKREFFGQDYRILRVDSCDRRVDEIGLKVSWSLPRGR